MFKRLFYFTIIFILSSCELLNIEEENPSLITIESIELNGNHTNKITDAWLYIDNEFQGVFPLPASFPVFKTGNQKILIEAGIKKNGISASRESYPYFTTYESQQDLIQGLVLIVMPC